jgi:Asp-tRNA(Asn)/Glu-tRNA(Gln) amidotransferase A subunit family amidase
VKEAGNTRSGIPSIRYCRTFFVYTTESFPWAAYRTAGGSDGGSAPRMAAIAATARSSTSSSPRVTTL